jgi:hypothetical protein
MLTEVDVLWCSTIIKSTFMPETSNTFALHKIHIEFYKKPQPGLHNRVKSPSSQQVRIANIDPPAPATHGA